MKFIAALILLGQENHRDVAGAGALAQSAANLIPVDVRQHDIQYNQVGQHGVRLFQSFGTTRSHIHIVAQAIEIDFQHVGDVIIVFHNQKACFSHKTSSTTSTRLVRVSAYCFDLLLGHRMLERAEAAQPKAMFRGQGGNLIDALAGDHFTQCVILEPAFQS